MRYVNSLLGDKVLFGSDFPAITPDRWIKDFGNLDIKPEVRALIMKQNAARLLRLGGAPPARRGALSRHRAAERDWVPG